MKNLPFIYWIVTNEKIDIMKKSFFCILLIWSLITSLTTKADTIDGWIVKRNELTIVNSNEVLIVHSNQPMRVNVASFCDGDTLQILYWTDCGLERKKWFYTFKDSNNVFIDKFTNSIDSSMRSIQPLGKTF